MSTSKKFGADLLTSNGRAGGHIIITDKEFTWKPFLVPWLDKMVFPIDELVGYVKNGTTLSIEIAGIDEFPSFYTWKGQSIVDAVKEVNPNFHMLASNEYTKKSGCSLALVALIIMSVGLFAVL